MPVSDQDAGTARYMVIPRTAIFLRRGESYLLMRGAASKRLWAGKYNGLGGHVEPGEDVLSSARRELREESGLDADLWLCGTIIVDAGEKGICLYVFTGENSQGDLSGSKEGSPEWVPYANVHDLPAVEDLETIIMRVHPMRRGDVPFAARSFYDEGGRLRVVFSE